MRITMPVVVALVLGMGLLSGSWFMYWSTRNLLDGAVRTSGTVVALERRSTKGGSSEYPVVEFTDRVGSMQRFTTSGAGQFTLGARVEVLYTAADPADVRVNDFLELWLGPLALGGFGLLCLGAGAASVACRRAE